MRLTLFWYVTFSTFREKITDIDYSEGNIELGADSDTVTAIEFYVFTFLCMF